MRIGSLSKYTILLLLLLQSASVIAAQGAFNEPTSERQELGYTDAIILGLVEGITEYLPISSTGHLIIANRLLALDSDTPILNNEDQPVKVKDNGKLRAYTLSEAAYAYAIVIQAGAIAAVCLLYWQTLLAMALGILGKDEKGKKLAVHLIVAFVPAAILGLLLDSWIESLLGNNVTAVAVALLIGAVVMLWVERWRMTNAQTDSETKNVESIGQSLETLTLSKSLIIGCFQCFALIPGTSRSMATIVGGYLAGLSPACAAEFSFLLGLITLSAASGYKLLTDGPEMLAALDLDAVLLGCFVAFVSAALAVKWLVGYLCKQGLAPFAWYRILLAILIFALIR